MSRRGNGSLVLRWPVALLALAGAWLGHLFEYVRVSGWHAALASTTSSVHVYFFPAGLALLGAVSGLSFAGGRLWRRLTTRLSAAEWERWRRSGAEPACEAVVSRRTRSPAPRIRYLWPVLTLLQLSIWVVQENLEAGAAGRHLPGLGVLAGVHALAPLVQAEVALFVTSLYCLFRRQLRRLEETVRQIEGLIARRWARTALATPIPALPALAALSPIERWGPQRWNRPPPAPDRTSLLLS